MREIQLLSTVLWRIAEMALEMLTRREKIYYTEYRLVFDSKTRPGSGYSFPCDKDGVLIQEADNPGRDERFLEVKADENYEFMGLKEYRHSYIEPASGKCKCGKIVYLDWDNGHGIDCECGRIYNLSGQELAPRSQWDDRYDDDSTQPYWAEFGYVD
jgi:hypothetical protein